MPRDDGQLTEIISSVLSNISNRPWLPGVAGQLAESMWRELYKDIDLCPSDYGTSRVMAHDASISCNIVMRLPVILSDKSLNRVLNVETLNEHFAHSYGEDGVRFYTADELSNTSVLKQLEEAIDILKSLPSICASATTLVKSIHLIAAGNDDYDVSFSEPHIPFSIFISVPKKHNRINALRVAEAIVHEAMHLQRTLIERNITLVKHTSQQYYSTWRGEYRNAQGMLHGLYVFHVINGFLRGLQTLSPYESDIVSYLEMRISEIHDQISCIKSFQASKDLTEIGTEFTKGIFISIAEI